MATYRCSGCGAEVARDAAICPSCHGHLAGVRCLHCGYSGSDREFRDDRCPMCGTRRAPHAEPHFRCPKCATPLPDIRRPKNRRQLLWGGWTCPGCGVELDRSRRVIQAAGAPAPAAALPPASIPRMAIGGGTVPHGVSCPPTGDGGGMGAGGNLSSHLLARREVQRTEARFRASDRL
jgi:DNA-directed RNA polymerase subunit RPC12/RpoP